MTLRVACSASFASLAIAQGWTQPSLAFRPPAAFGSAMVYHEQRAELIWFGGATSTAAWPPSALQQTWAFGNGTWSQRTPAASPPARQRHAMGYSPSDQQVYMFGGLDTSGAPLNDLWRYDGTNWFPVWYLNPPPIARADAAFMTQPSLQPSVQIVGGWSPTAGHLADAWACLASWDSAYCTWYPMPVLPAGPRRGAALALISWPEPPPVNFRERLLLHGGRDDTQVFSDTWVLASSGWQSLPQAGGPARAGHGMHRHSSERMVFLVGGVDAPTGAPLDDVWRFDGERWLALHPTMRPPAVIAPATAWDAGRTRLVRVGGRDAAGSLDAHWEFEPLRLEPLYFGATCNTLGLSANLRVQPASRSADWTGQFYFTTGHNMTFTLFLVGFSNQSWNGLPLPLSLASLWLPQCQLLVEPAWTQWSPTIASPANLRLPIPSTPSLYGVELFAQALSGNSFGVHVASNAARVMIW
jgi:hypothetical protein